MSNYKDIELKLKYYKEQILKQFIKKVFMLMIN